MSIYINKVKAGKKLIKSVTAAMSNPKILTEKGGFLFKISYTQNKLYFGIIPSFLGGERTHHYEIEMNHEDEYTLIGGINSSGVMTLLFKPAAQPLRKEAKSNYYKTFQTFAFFLFNNGYRSSGELDWITRKLLADSGVCTADVRNLKEFSDPT